jgi:DNA-binding ferritin-like protein
MENQSRNLLKRSVEVSTPTTNYAKGSVNTMMSTCITELMNASTSFHKLHLRVTGVGSFAAHKALNDLYDALPDFADTIAESYQGFYETLLVYNESLPVTLNSVTDAISHIKKLHVLINNLQDNLKCSEIINDLDTIKSALNSAKYKLIFLK